MTRTCIVFPSVVALTILTLLTGRTAARTTPEEKPAWPGSITRTVTFSGMEGSERVTFRRVERWDTFVVTNGEPDGSTAFFDTTWTLTESRKEVGDRCTTMMEAQGSKPYPWFTFDVNPFDEVSYQLYSAGTGEGGPEVQGTLTQTCRGGEITTMPYTAAASWLPAMPMDVPADLLPDGVELPKPDLSGFGPAVAGTLDVAHPGLLRGTATTTDVNGMTTTLTWELSRAADCGGDEEARQLLARESSRLATAEETTPDPPGPPVGPQPAPPGARITANQPLSAHAVAAALGQAVSQPDRMTVREATGTSAAGLRRFAVRLAADGRALPSLATLRQQIESTCVAPGSIEGAPTLLVGSVQWAGNRFRIDIRTVETETGIVTDSVSDSGIGGSAELQTALEGLLDHYIGG